MPFKIAPDGYLPNSASIPCNTLANIPLNTINTLTPQPLKQKANTEAVLKSKLKMLAIINTTIEPGPENTTVISTETREGGYVKKQVKKIIKKLAWVLEKIAEELGDVSEIFNAFFYEYGVKPDPNILYIDQSGDALRRYPKIDCEDVDEILKIFSGLLVVCDGKSRLRILKFMKMVDFELGYTDTAKVIEVLSVGLSISEIKGEDDLKMRMQMLDWINGLKGHTDLLISLLPHIARKTILNNESKAIKDKAIQIVKSLGVTEIQDPLFASSIRNNIGDGTVKEVTKFLHESLMFFLISIATSPEHVQQIKQFDIYGTKLDQSFDERKNSRTIRESSSRRTISNKSSDASLSDNQARKSTSRKGSATNIIPNSIPWSEYPSNQIHAYTDRRASTVSKGRKSSVLNQAIDKNSMLDMNRDLPSARPSFAGAKSTPLEMLPSINLSPSNSRDRDMSDDFFVKPHLPSENFLPSTSSIGRKRASTITRGQDIPTLTFINEFSANIESIPISAVTTRPSHSGRKRSSTNAQQQFTPSSISIDSTKLDSSDAVLGGKGRKRSTTITKRPALIKVSTFMHEGKSAGEILHDPFINDYVSALNYFFSVEKEVFLEETNRLERARLDRQREFNLEQERAALDALAMLTGSDVKKTKASFARMPNIQNIPLRRSRVNLTGPVNRSLCHHDTREVLALLKPEIKFGRLKMGYINSSLNATYKGSRRTNAFNFVVGGLDVKINSNSGYFQAGFRSKRSESNIDSNEVSDLNFERAVYHETDSKTRSFTTARKLFFPLQSNII